MNRNILVLALSVILFSQGTMALPIDWEGKIGFDASLIKRFRKIGQTAESATINNGSQEVSLANGDHANASWQSYLLALRPILLINDAATFKAEISTGYARGGRFGQDSTQNKDGSFGNALYFHNTGLNNTDVNGDSSKNILRFNLFHLDLYTDTATYKIGRHTDHWGLGAIVNSGDKLWDRHFFARDGISMEIKLGNFQISPYWGKIGSDTSLTRATSTKEWGFSLLYDNPEKEIAFGIYHRKKWGSTYSTTLQSQLNTTTNRNLGKSNVKMWDLYLRKRWGDFEMAVEAPILDGDIENFYATNSKTNLKTYAVLFNSNYKLNESWNIGLDLGLVNGDDGAQTKFEAMFLNPNFQIANLMFRYNPLAVDDPNDERSIYDSYISNTKFAKLYVNYFIGKWEWNAGLIYALAKEAAKSGSLAYNHTKNKTFTAAADQEDDLGLEIDLNFDYHWNKEITIGGSGGYHFVGDYYAFTNTATKNEAKNSFVLQIRAGVNF